MRRLLRAALAVGIGLLAGLAIQAPAQAHAYLARSAPSDGANLDRSPELLTLSFTEHVELGSTKVDIVDGDGRHWAVTALSIRDTDPAQAGTALAAGTESPVEVVAGLPVLPPNVYHVAWRTISSDDLHLTSGTLVIGVQRQVTGAAAPPGPGGPAIRETVLRAAGLAGLATLIGGAALALLLATGTGRSRSTGPLRDRLLRTSAGAGVLVLIATPAQLLIQVSGAGNRWAALLLQQVAAGRWALRELGAAALLGAVVLARRGVRPQRYRILVAVGAAGALAASTGTALLGHPARSGLITWLAGGAHVLAAAGWGGAVLAGALALVPVLRTRPEQAGAIRVLLRAFSLLAVVAVAVLAVTGLLLTSEQVATVDALLLTPYGLLLLVKVALVVVAGLIGLRTARRLRRLGEVSPRRLTAEAAVLVLVLSLAGAIAAAGPARGPRFPTTHAVVASSEASGQVADLIDSVTVAPNRPGPNVITIVIHDTRRPVPGPITGVSVQLTGPDGTSRIYPVTRTEELWKVSVDDIRADGQWRIAVTINRTGLPPVTDAHDWGVGPAGADPGTVVVSSRPLAPLLGALALLLGLGAVLLGLVWAYRRRRASTGRLAVPAARHARVPTQRTNPDGVGEPDAGANPDGAGEPDAAGDPARAGRELTTAAPNRYIVM